MHDRIDYDVFWGAWRIYCPEKTSASTATHAVGESVEIDQAGQASLPSNFFLL